MTKMSRGAGGEHCGAATGCVVTEIVANFGPGPTPESGDSVWGAISMDVETPSVRRGSRLSALQVELSCGAFVCGGGALASGGVRKMSGDGPAGHGGVVVIRWVTKMSAGAGAVAAACGGHGASRWGIALRNQTESDDESPGTRPWRGLGAGGEALLQRPAIQNGSGTAPI